MIEQDDFVVLSRELSAAELRDYIGVDLLGYGVREWAREISIAHQSISPRLRSAREKLEGDLE